MREGGIHPKRFLHPEVGELPQAFVQLRLPEEVEIQVRPKPLPAPAVLKERRRLRWADGTGEPSELRPYRPGTG
ncbi:hypothetical protein [Hydrogenibacillus schlegelii]|uniref:hypothetical protein n=1 Tax=Hydrogenibacillus schlegelii TaxID=1484 RepID=UPI0034A0AA0D